MAGGEEVKADEETEQETASSNKGQRGWSWYGQVRVIAKDQS